MIGDLPLGYATVQDFEHHTARTFDGTNRQVAGRLIRMAEEIINFYAGDRRFLPVTAKLAADMTDTALTFTTTAAANLFPDHGYCLIGPPPPAPLPPTAPATYEVMEYGNPVWHDASGSTPDTVTFQVISRGRGPTTPIAHCGTTTESTVPENVYVLHMVEGTDKPSLYIGDFLELGFIWGGGYPTYPWIPIITTYMQPKALMEGGPYQFLARRGFNWERSIQFWVSAVWGYSWSVPASIKYATLLQAEHMMLQRGGSLTLISKETWEGYQAQYRDPAVVPPTVKQILDPYRRITLL